MLVIRATMITEIEFVCVHFLLSIIETGMSSLSGFFFCHWLQWKLSFWQRPVQRVIQSLSKWQHFCFSDLPYLGLQRREHSVAPLWLRNSLWPCIVLEWCTWLSCSPGYSRLLPLSSTPPPQYTRDPVTPYRTSLHLGMGSQSMC